LVSVDVISAREVDPGLDALWRGFLAADPDLRSPFFTPDFFRIVAEVRPDTRLAVLSEAGRPSGFFAFHRQPFGRLAPLAGQLSDYHGIIGPARIAPRALLRGLGAQVYDFNHVPATQPMFRRAAFLEASSPLVDLSEGFEAWRLERRASGRTFAQTERRGRQIGREVGPLRFAATDHPDEVWQSLLDWKRASLDAIGVKFILDQPWAREIIERVRAADTPDFGGETLALWAGDNLIAVTFGLHTATTAHAWFPTYNVAFRRNSPGLVMLVETLRHAAERGITEYDFGRGDEEYKAQFANGQRALSEGALLRPLTPLGASRALRGAAQKLVTRFGTAAQAEFARRAGNRLLSAGRLF